MQLGVAHMKNGVIHMLGSLIARVGDRSVIIFANEIILLLLADLTYHACIWGVFVIEHP